MTTTERHNLESYRSERARRSNVDDELCRVLFVAAIVVVTLTVLARVVWQ